jgi:hypothetical protein
MSLIVGIDRSKETALVALVARSAGLFDKQQDCVCVTVDASFFDNLLVSASFPFSPEFTATATKVDRALGLNGFSPCRLVHPRHHEDAAGFKVLCNRRK